MEFKVIHIDETDSTNRWLRRLYSTDHESSLAVWAEYQTAGQGCGSNSWESEGGKNLTFSLLLHPTEIPAECQFRISEAVSVAICETLDGLLPREHEVTIKWPNDIYVGDQKICGILIENQLRGRLISDSIVGIGLNVNQMEFKSDAPNPVSAAQIIGHEVDREALLQALLQRLPATMELVPEALMQTYRGRLYRREGYHPFRDSHGGFEAKVMNVLDDGRLVLLDTEGTARIYTFKEVEFLINPT